HDALPISTVPPHRPFIHNIFDDDHHGRNSLLSGPKILLEQRLTDIAEFRSRAPRPPRPHRTAPPPHAPIHILFHILRPHFPSTHRVVHRFFGEGGEWNRMCVRSWTWNRRRRRTTGTARRLNSSH